MAQNVVAALYADIILVKDHVWEVFGELYRCKLNIKETYKPTFLCQTDMF